MTQTQEPPAFDKTSAERSDALQPWQLFTLAGLIGATIVVFMSRGQTPAGIILLSLIIFAAASVGLAALRTFLPFAEKILDSGSEGLGGRARSVLEREKGLLLRFIKELEFDRRMGKVSEKDFAEMSARLRSRAARVMRQLDAGSLYREEIEREVRRRLSDAGSAARSTAPEVQRDDDAGSAVRSASPFAQPEPAYGTQDGARRPADAIDGPATCASCRTENDPDAKFCKHCGTRLEAVS